MPPPLLRLWGVENTESHGPSAGPACDVEVFIKTTTSLFLAIEECRNRKGMCLVVICRASDTRVNSRLWARLRAQGVGSVTQATSTCQRTTEYRVRVAGVDSEIRWLGQCQRRTSAVARCRGFQPPGRRWFSMCRDAGRSACLDPNRPAKHLDQGMHHALAEHEPRGKQHPYGAHDINARPRNNGESNTH